MAAVVLAAMLAACGGESGSGDKPVTPTTTTSASPTPRLVPTIAPASIVKKQYPQFVSTDDATIDETGANVCRVTRDSNLGTVVSAVQDSLHMSRNEAVDFVYAVAIAYCPEVPRPDIAPLLSTTPTPPVAPPAPATTITPGTWLVGSNIQPGTYETTTASTAITDSCYWARLSGTSGDSDEILANGNVQGHGIVTIKPTDNAFQTRCTWTKLG
ncbi:hypothetical protein [Pseudofrankia asymbiotica]|uniref:DUF732 domain-containing protein n=1 Tax=Pseudofrankia asymbiotica TaxID=1834516 RepID=A0A1V2IDZ9_9ACTN|nr:hypothetical protein [Pseudofrankia asymbiotica]ONH31418.1 hypothetical protein BL253_09225 [Pseudofrankia asymbiotica]